MKATIDQELCTACELCVDTCPDVYEMSGDYAVVKVKVIPANQEESARQAAEDCPVEAIKIED